MVRKHVTVRGQVQGVGFRWSARAEAQELGITGFARNHSDGSVEAEVQGPEEKVERMLHWLASGPEFAVVESVDAREVDAHPGEKSFQIL